MICVSPMAARQDDHFSQRCWLQCQHALLILFTCCEQVKADSWFESTQCQRLPNRSDCAGRMDGSWLRPWADEMKVTDTAFVGIHMSVVRSAKFVPEECKGSTSNVCTGTKPMRLWPWPDQIGVSTASGVCSSAGSAAGQGLQQGRT